jgi:hypothetical protein
MSSRGVRATLYRLSQTLGSLSLRGDWLNRIPILYTVLGFVLIVGVIYYYDATRRHRVPVVPSAKTGTIIIATESVAPDEISEK